VVEKSKDGEKKVVKKDKSGDNSSKEVKQKEQFITLGEFCMIKGIVNNWAQAFVLYCKKKKDMTKRSFKKWDDALNSFKNTPL